jgi:hypothetical protein
MKLFSRRNLLAAGILCAAVLAVLPWRSFEQPVSPPPAAAPDTAATERCKVGIFFVDLHQFEIQKRSFNANFWLWSVCASAQRQPLKVLEFVNANSTTGTLDQTTAREGVTWSQRKIDGNFRQDWDVRDFPFDRHVLSVTMEEGVDDTRAFNYDADTDRSGYDKNIDVPGWRVTGFKLVPSERRYDTTFGDPSLPPNASAHYSRLQAEISVVRTNTFTSFFKMASVVYVAATLALLSFLFHLDSGGSFGSRISFLAGSLFATVINMRIASTELGSNDGLTLIDLIHITALILIISATILTIIADRQLETGKKQSVRRFDFRNAVVCATLFLAANVVLIVHAAIRG